jgi:hypothetical protein
MSSTGSPTLTVDVAARHGERRIVLATLLIAPLAVLQLELRGLVLAVVLILALTAIVGGFRAINWLGDARRLTRIVCQSDGSWLLYEAGGRVTETDLTNATRFSTHALWLCWSGRRLRPLLLLRGDLPAADFRRLRVRLRVAPFRDPEPIEDVL